MDVTPAPPAARTRKKPSYLIGPELRAYLRRYRRERELPVTYGRLRQGLAEHFQSDHYLRCETMGALVRTNLEMLRANIQRGQGALQPDQILSTLPRA